VSGGRECQREDTAQLEEQYGYGDDGDDRSSLLGAAERRRRRGRMGKQRNYCALEGISPERVFLVVNAEWQTKTSGSVLSPLGGLTNGAPTASRMLVSIIKWLARRRVAG